MTSTTDTNTTPAPLDPIVRMDGKWYFYIETWADTEGPFDSREEAEAALKQYCIQILG